jgi:hypothetical protein
MLGKIEENYHRFEFSNTYYSECLLLPCKVSPAGLLQAVELGVINEATSPDHVELVVLCK